MSDYVKPIVTAADFQRIRLELLVIEKRCEELESYDGSPDAPLAVVAGEIRDAANRLDAILLAAADVPVDRGPGGAGGRFVTPDPITGRHRLGCSVLVLAALLATTPALAGDLTVRSRLFPGPGILQPGSSLNPYVIQENGRVVGTIRPRALDVDPDDGFMDPGTPMNPWVIDTDD